MVVVPRQIAEVADDACSVYATTMASRKPKTGFDKYVQARMQDRDFASAYKEARAEVHAVDGLMRQLDEARQRAKLSKADLARRASTPQESVRRLLTAKRTNPSLQTVVRLARAVGLRVELARATRSNFRRGVSAKAHS
jgi:DNA-binding phage protein